MPVQATTPQAVRATISSAIEAIEPSHVETSEYAWNRLDDNMDPRGCGVRNFQVLTGLAVMEGDGMFGCDTIAKRLELVIRVSYSGLIGNDFSDAVNSDQSDIWRALHPLPGGLGTPANGIINFDDFLLIEPHEDPDIGEGGSSNLTVDFVTVLHYHSD